MSAETSTIDPSAAAANMEHQTQEALRQQALWQAEQQAAAMVDNTTQHEAARTDFWEDTRQQESNGTSHEIAEALRQNPDFVNTSSDSPIEGLYATIASDMRGEDAVDAKAGTALENMLASGQVTAEDMATTAEAVRLLATYGEYKLNRWGNPAQLEQAVRIMTAYTERAPGFDPQAAGLPEVKANLIKTLAALEADKQTKPHLEYAQRYRSHAGAVTTEVLDQVCALEAQTGSAPQPTAETGMPEQAASREDLTDYLDFLRDDLNHEVWFGNEKGGQRSLVDALGRAMDDAPDGDPLAIVDDRLAQLSRVTPPSSESQRAQYDFQVAQLQKLRNLVSTTEGVETMRESVAVWRGEPYAQASAGAEEVAAAQGEQPADQPEARKGMSEEDVRRAQEMLGGLVISGTVTKPGEAQANSAPETTAEAAAPIDYESLSPAELKDATRKLVDSLSAKYGHQPLTPAERKVWLDGVGKPFTGDVLQRAAEIQAQAMTTEEASALTRATNALGPLERAGDPDASALNREASPISTSGNFVSNDPEQLGQLLTAIGFSPDRVAHYTGALRAEQAKQTPGRQAEIAISFSRDRLKDTIDDRPMNFLRSMRRQ